MSAVKNLMYQLTILGFIFCPMSRICVIYFNFV